MRKNLRAFAAALALGGIALSFGLAPCARAGVGDSRDVYTPGYFLDEQKFDGDVHRYYHDYAMEKLAGVTPSISPYLDSPRSLLNWTNFNSIVLTVRDAGRYVASWHFYGHGDRSQCSGSVSDAPKSLNVTYAMLNGFSGSIGSFDVIPLLRMMEYTLAYEANGGTWLNEPEETAYIWSNAVTVASSSCISRTGYTFTGWNTRADGGGLAFEPGEVLTNASGGARFEVDDHLTNVTLFARWKAKAYTLALTPGAGIEKIRYKTSASAEEWSSTSEPLGVPVDFDSTWCAYAVAKPGYTYATYTEKNPLSGVMTTQGAAYAPVATTNRISVAYDGNGATSGSTASSTFFYDRPGFLSANGFTRTYAVKFGGNGSSVTVSPSSAVATYAFAGWNSEKDGTGEYSFAEGAVVTNVCGSTGADVRLYAQWKPGSVELPYATRTGYAFLGWYADKDGRYRIGGAGDSYTPTKSVTLYAKWSATANALRFRFGTGISRIYYRLDGASAWTPVSGDGSVSLAYGTKWSAYAVARSGFTYAATSADRPASGQMKGEDAVFAPEATAKTYTVTYDGNGKSGGSTTTSRLTFGETGRLADNTFTRVYRVNLNANGSGATVEPTQLEATSSFTGWNTEPDGSGTAYGNQAEVRDLSLGAGVTLYAQWKEGSVVLPEPTWEGHAFLGWSAEAMPSSSQAGTPFLLPSGATYTPTANATLFAQWTRETCTVTFVDGYAGPGAATVPPTIRIEAVPYGGAATAPTPPAHAGYQFGGWSDDCTEVTGDLTVTAQYKAVGYHVTYHSNVGKGKDSAVSSAGCGPGSEQGVDSLKLLDVGDRGLGFTKPGYRFVGWSWTADATNADWIAGNTMAWNVISERMGTDNCANLYAIWEPIAYAVVYAPGFELADAADYNGGVTNQTLTYDRPERLLANPYALDRQRFLGWKIQSSASDAPLFSDEQLVTNLTQTAGETVVLTAVWDGNGDHTLVFDPSDPSGTLAPTSQLFCGTNAQYLASNVFTRVGYAFAGWTNAANAASRFLDRASYAFPAETPRHSTNTFYAVWEPITYSIVFNTGTNGVLGTIQPMTNCVYDSLPIELPNSAYENQCSTGFAGWSLTRGGELVAENTHMDCTLSTNLTSLAGECVTLYAVWNDIGDLSRSVGLTNAALVADETVTIDAQSKVALWFPDRTGESGRSPCVAIDIGDRLKVRVGDGEGYLHTKVYGGGTLSFEYFMSDGVKALFEVFAGDLKMEDLNVAATWTSKTIRVDGEGWHTISWRVKGLINLLDVIALDRIRWMPDESEPVEWPTYRIDYAGTNGCAALSGEYPAAYRVTDGTIDLSSLPKPVRADGYVFAGWMPSKIEKGTTGDLTVRATWRKPANPVTVTYELGEGLVWATQPAARICVNAGDDVTPPADVIPETGYRFAGWYDEEGRLVCTEGGVIADAEALRVRCDATFTAKAEPVAYRIDYENVPTAVENPNPLGFAIADLPVEIRALSDARDATFVKWEPSPTVDGASNVTLRAVWTPRLRHTVTFVLGDHLARTGGGALVQEVGDGQCVSVAPTVRTDEGYSFVGWRLSDATVTADATACPISGDTTFVAVLSAKVCVLSSGGTSEAHGYGETVTMRATAAGCIGWIGTGCVPGSGTASEVTFTVTGDGELTWLYGTDSGDTAISGGGDGGETSFPVSVSAGEGGSVRVLDSAGGVLDASAFDAPTGIVLTAEAKAATGWRFAGWNAVEASAERVRTFTVDGPVALKAVFARVFTVTFDLGDHLVQTGETALVQSVVSNGCATIPGFVVDEGCVFEGWLPHDASDRITGDTAFVADVTVSEHELALGDRPVTAAYGGSVTATAPFDVLTTNGADVVCVGWIGTGSVPASGVSTQVTFTVTGGGTLRWLYETNFWVSVASGDGARGSVTVLDPAGGVCGTNAFWAAAGAELTAIAKTRPGYRFAGWTSGGDGTSVSAEASLSLTVTNAVSLVAAFDDPLKPKHEVAFEMGEHLTRTGGGALRQTVEEGASAVLPIVTPDEGWFVKGWRVDATSPSRPDVDGEGFLIDAAGRRVFEGSVTNILASLTFTSVATQKCVRTRFNVSVSVACGCQKMGAVTGSRANVKAGTAVTVRAAAKTGCVFSGWYPSGADGCPLQGATPLSQSAAYAFAMPSDDVALAALFIAKSADWAAVSVGETEVDCVKGAAIDPIAVTATGGSLPTVKVTGLPTGLKFTAKDVVDTRTKRVAAAANTIYGTPTRSGVYRATVSATTLGKATASTNVTFIVRARGEYAVTADAVLVDAGGTRASALPGKTAGEGVYKPGRKVTLRATANAGYVFSGWYPAGAEFDPCRGETPVSRLSSFAFAMPERNLAYEAAFVTTADDAASLSADVNGLALIDGGVAATSATNVTAGVYLEWPVAAEALSATSVVVSGLPSGLRFTAKPVTSRVTTKVGGKSVTTVVTNVPAMTIYGTPAAAGKTDRYGRVTPSTVKVTVKTAGRNRATGVLRLTVGALPDGLVSTCVGGALEDAGGFATVTLAKTGKVSGKWISAGRTWTLSAAFLDRVDLESSECVATVTAKCGTLIDTLTLRFAASDVAAGESHGAATVCTVVATTASCEDGGETLFSARGANWKAEPWKALATRLRNTTFAVSGEDVALSGKVGANGTVSVTGTFAADATSSRQGLYTATASSTLEPLGEDRFELFVCFPPKTAKGFSGFATRLVLVKNGSSLEVEPCQDSSRQ